MKTQKLSGMPSPSKVSDRTDESEAYEIGLETIQDRNEQRVLIAAEGVISNIVHILCGEKWLNVKKRRPERK
jgi:hypothetical protein